MHTGFPGIRFSGRQMYEYWNGSAEMKAAQQERIRQEAFRATAYYPCQVWVEFDEENEIAVVTRKPISGTSERIVEAAEELMRTTLKDIYLGSHDSRATQKDSRSD